MGFYGFRSFFILASLYFFLHVGVSGNGRVRLGWVMKIYVCAAGAGMDWLKGTVVNTCDRILYISA